MYERTGNLFQRPFKRIHVSTPEYLLNLIHYIHFNPQKHGFVEDFREYKFSSFSAFLSEKETKIDRKTVLDWFQGKNEFIIFHKRNVNEKDILNFVEDDFD